MTKVIIIILIIILFYSCIRCDEIQFRDPFMKKFYKKNNIKIDKKRNILIKNNVVIDISNGCLTVAN
jgi:hypothetical protein